MRLKLRATIGEAPSAAVTDRTASSVVLSGRRGSLASRGGVKRMMVSVAAYVSWNPMSKRLAGLARRRAKALAAIVFKTWTSCQRSRPPRKARVMSVARSTDGLPSTRAV